MNNFLTYLKSFFLSMKNVFTLLSFLFFLSSFFVQKLDPWKEQFQTLALVVAFFFAGYFAWRRDRKPPEDSLELRVSLSEPALEPRSFHGGGRLGKLHLFVDADIVNPRAAICLLERPKLQTFETGTDLFLRSDGKMKITLKGEPLMNAPFPMKLGPNDRTLLHIQVEMDTKTDDPKVVAQSLASLRAYSLEFALYYSFDAGERREKRFPVSGLYDAFKQSVFKHWQDNNLHELLCIAHGIKT
jgi:hypothetical protein